MNATFKATLIANVRNMIADIRKAEADYVSTEGGYIVRSVTRPSEFLVRVTAGHKLQPASIAIPQDAEDTLERASKFATRWNALLSEKEIGMGFVVEVVTVAESFAARIAELESNLVEIEAFPTA